MSDSKSTEHPSLRAIIKKPTWECHLFGIGPEGIVLKVEKPPLFIWRWMQYIFLGNKWRKIDE